MVNLADMDNDDVADKDKEKDKNKVYHLGKHDQLDQPVVQLKFDRVELSTFSGDHTEWISFRDEFLQLVHTNKKISEVVKFHQLKTHPRGIALEAVMF